MTCDALNCLLMSGLDNVQCSVYTMNSTWIGYQEGQGGIKCDMFYYIKIQCTHNIGKTMVYSTITKKHMKLTYTFKYLYTYMN